MTLSLECVVSYSTWVQPFLIDLLIYMWHRILFKSSSEVGNSSSLQLPDRSKLLMYLSFQFLWKIAILFLLTTQNLILCKLLAFVWHGVQLPSFFLSCGWVQQSVLKANVLVGSISTVVMFHQCCSVEFWISLLIWLAAVTCPVSFSPWIALSWMPCCCLNLVNHPDDALKSVFIFLYITLCSPVLSVKSVV